jgi:hypothetical protein
MFCSPEQAGHYHSPGFTVEASLLVPHCNWWQNKEVLLKKPDEKILVSWNIMLYSMVDKGQRFLGFAAWIFRRETYTEAAGSSEALAPVLKRLVVRIQKSAVKISTAMLTSNLRNT